MTSEIEESSVLFWLVMSVVLVLAVFTTGAFAQGILYLNVNDHCKSIGEVQRICKRFSDCPEVQEAIRRRLLQDICSFEGDDPIVCCPIVKTTINTPAPPASIASDSGDVCLNGSPQWFCRTQRDCPGIQEAIRNGLRPKICSFEGRTPVLCCPPSRTSAQQTTILTTTSHNEWSRPSHWPTFSRPETTQQPTRPTRPVVWGEGGNGWTTKGTTEDYWWNSRPIGKPTPKPTARPTQTQSEFSKADQMCKKYSKYVFEKSQLLFLPGAEETKVDYCGRVVTPLIVGGEDAGPREFPHIARIGYGEKPRIMWLCGGSLISERYVLSAAHCTKPFKNQVAKWVNLGELDTSTENDEADPVNIRIIERIDHPGYTDKQLYHDISLYKLEKDAPLGKYIRPICLNTHKVLRETKAVASGWGHTVWGGREGSKKLQKVELDFRSASSCNQSYIKHIPKELANGIVSEYQICAGGIPGKDTCQGDSGGPLQIPLATPYCMYAIVGVTSFGKGCGTDTPGVYTNVAHYVPWIESIVWPS